VDQPLTPEVIAALKPDMERGGMGASIRPDIGQIDLVHVPEWAPTVTDGHPVVQHGAVGDLFATLEDAGLAPRIEWVREDLRVATSTMSREDFVAELKTTLTSSETKWLQKRSDRLRKALGLEPRPVVTDVAATSRFLKRFAADQTSSQDQEGTAIVEFSKTPETSTSE
jgi:hypothetical protein